MKKSQVLSYPTTDLVADLVADLVTARSGLENIKHFFMLISTKHRASTAHNNQNGEKKCIFLALNLSDCVFIIINVKMAKPIGILKFMRRINFMPS